MSAFRISCGIVTGLSAVGFLAANTIILARYGWRVGEDDTEKMINAIVAGQVPVVLALMPFILAITWRPGHYRPTRSGGRKWKGGRPSPIAIIGVALWAVFVSFNFMGAIGSIALQRNTFVDKREGQRDDAARWKETRADKKRQLDQIKEDRTPEAIQNKLDATKLHRFWKATDGCAEDSVLNKGHRDYCAEVKSLTGAISTAQLSIKLRAEIEDLDRKLETPAAHINSADPQSETLASYASMLSGRQITANHVRTFQPLMWFLLLELSCMFLGYVTLKFFKFDHAELFDHVELVPVTHQLPPPRTKSQVAAAMAAADHAEAVQAFSGGMAATLATSDPGLQRAVYDRFWTQCVRPMPGGKEPLLALFKAYMAFCDQQHCQPYQFEEFGRALPDSYRNGSNINGVLWVMGLVLADPMRAAS